MVGAARVASGQCAPQQLQLYAVSCVDANIIFGSLDSALRLYWGAVDVAMCARQS